MFLEYLMYVLGYQTPSPTSGNIRIDIGDYHRHSHVILSEMHSCISYILRPQLNNISHFEKDLLIHSVV